MNREEFIEWFKVNITDEISESGYAREMTEYEPLRYDEYWINNNDIEFQWEEPCWGYTENHNDTYDFETFIEKYNKSELK